VRQLAGKVALVTGAASGMGRAMALALARERASLVLADIDPDGLDAAAAEVSRLSTCVLAQTVDVSKREDMAALAEQVHDLVPCLDILVNNAGVYVAGGILDLSLDDWEWSLSTNLWGMIHGAHFFVPKMVLHDVPGHVVNMCSMYGYWTAPDVIAYLTAKFGVFGFSEALRHDLRRHHITVSTVCPGIIRTDIVKNMRLRTGDTEERTRQQLERLYQRRDYGPEKVAQIVLKAIHRRRKLVLISPEAHLMYHIARLFPPLSHLIARITAKRMFR